MTELDPRGMTMAQSRSVRLTQDELLVLLIEECGEVIQAATKCLRFGYDVDHGTGYGNNSVALAKEAGELTAVIRELSLPQVSAYQSSHANKIDRAQIAKATYGRRALQGDSHDK